MINSTQNDDQNQAGQKLPSTTEAQQFRLLKYLTEVGPINTFQAREVLDVAHPAGRIQGLKKMGHDIHTNMVVINNGIAKHRIAEYVLIKQSMVANDG